MSSPYNPLYNLGLLQNLNPTGQALGSAAPISSLPGGAARQALPMPSGQAQAAMQPQTLPANNAAMQPTMQQAIPFTPPPTPAAAQPQLATGAPSLAAQTAQNPLAGVNAMQGTPARPQNQWQQALGQMGNFMTGGGAGAAASPGASQGPGKGTLGQIGNVMAGGVAGGTQPTAAGQTKYPPAPQFSPIQLPQSQAVQGNPQGLQNWQALLAALNRNPNTGQ